MDLARRGFLRGRSRAGRVVVRPPWAVSEVEFLERCTRCGECMRTCETGLLIAGDGGFPEVDFARAGCSFCGQCLRVCQPGVLQRRGEEAPWRLRIEIGDDCLAWKHVVCRTCGERCDAGAIRFRPQVGGVGRPELDGTRCTGCGECVGSCPTGAIAMKPVSDREELPE